MRYPIGVLSKLYGFTKEALRFYEKRGIIKAQRDEGNGYRYYDESDAQKLGAIKRMQKIGFSLDEANNLYQKASIPLYAKAYDEKSTLLRQEIELKSLILQRLDEDRQHLERLPQHLFEFTLGENKGYYMLKITNAEQLLTDKKTLKSLGLWCEQFMLSSFFFTFLLHSQRMTMDGRGMMIEKSVAQRIQLDLHEVNDSLASGPCIKCLVTWGKNLLDWEQIIQRAVLFAAENQVILSDKAHLIVLLSFYDEEACYKSYGELIIPLAGS